MHGWVLTEAVAHEQIADRRCAAVRAVRNREMRPARTAQGARGQSGFAATLTAVWMAMGARRAPASIGCEA